MHYIYSGKQHYLIFQADDAVSPFLPASSKFRSLELIETTGRSPHEGVFTLPVELTELFSLTLVV